MRVSRLAVMLALVAVFSFTALVFAQAAPDPTFGTGQVPYALLLWVLGQPFVVQALVNRLKVLTFVKQNPKVAAVALNLIGVFIEEALFQTLPGDLRTALAALIQAVMQGLGSTGIHEWIYPRTKTITLSPKP